MKKNENIRLNMLGLPVIQTVEDFSQITHLSKQSIYDLSVNAGFYYKSFKKAKKSGGHRVISQPSKNLKGLQAWILVNILNKLNTSDSCKGFEKGSSISDNARPHINANCVLNIDLSDFFDTVTDIQIYNIFKSIGYNSLISTIFSKICTNKGRLPQGSPCSPKLANLVTWKLDKRIQGYVGKKGITYTRYADDLTFSSLHPSTTIQILPLVKRIIEDEGFIVNNRKTRFAGASRRKKITGLIISNNRYGIGNEKYKILRSKIYHLTKTKEQKNLELLNHVNGWISYLKSVDKVRYNRLYGYVFQLKNLHPKTLVKKVEISNNTHSK
jgi:RNA-directed DNA polymerase